MEIRNKKGFTIIEVLVALSIVSIILIGLLASLNISYEINTKNLIRDEAVKIAQEYVNKYINTEFDSIPSNDTINIDRQIRNYEINYTVQISSTDIPGGLVKKLTIKVNWTYKGKNYSYEIKTMVSKNV